MGNIAIEKVGSHDSGICDCCGRASRCIWGYVHADETSLAVYYVHWTLGHVLDQGANIDLIVGEWGEASTPEQRSALALDYRLLETGPSIMVIDAITRPVSESSLAGKALYRNEVIGTPYADDAFAIADAILAQDDRINELLGAWTIGN